MAESKGTVPRTEVTVVPPSGTVTKVTVPVGLPEAAAHLGRESHRLTGGRGTGRHGGHHRSGRGRPGLIDGLRQDGAVLVVKFASPP